ncbi:ECF-type sigma factor [Streptomyces sp. Pv4-95]|uniref:ECF-type sigma factor n=1 Tax=Streptomyces sp. Pv4-95 TaxID=3049543 RepID=UPI003891D700
MTDTTIAPVAGSQAPPDAPPPPQPEDKPAPAAEIDHTSGGWPVVPLAVTGTNATTSLLATAALVGGPAALAAAATGAVVLGTAAATRKHRSRKAKGKTGGRAPAGTASTGRSTRHGAAGRVPLQKRPSSPSKGGSSGRAAGSTGVGKTGSGGRAGMPNKSRSQSAGSGTAAGKERGRAGQVKALRESARQSSPSRAARRADTAGSRRSVADARRNAKAAARSGSLARKGAAGRAASKAAGRVGKARGAAIERNRAARDQRAAGQVAGQRDAVRKAPVRKKARKALWRSAARHQGRRLLAALLGGALGLVGAVTTPLGRKLGWAWLQHPGRRLFRHVMRTAEERKAARDTAIREQLAAEEAALDETAEGEDLEIGDSVQRPFHLLPAPFTTAVEVVSMSGFKFEEAAAEMENAARTYEPENSMEILSMVENLPDALTSVANTFRILAERSDSEFPLEKDIAGAFDEIYGALIRAVDASADLGDLFHQVHEHDISRHEDPRNGPEAEKGWNV